MNCLSGRLGKGRDLSGIFFIGEESKVDTILAIRKEKILSWKASSKLKVDVFHLECDALF